MKISYNKLFKRLEEKDVKKTQLLKDIGISSSTLAKFAKREFVSMEILVKICEYFNCDIGDIVEVTKPKVEVKDEQ